MSKTYKAKIFEFYKSFAIVACMTAAISILSCATAMAETLDRRVTVTGNGLLKVTPDIAYLNVGVRTSDKDAETASSENMKITERILESLEKSGIDKKDMKTQNYNIYPNFDYNRENGSSTIIGYEVTNSLNVTIRNIKDVGKIIDECISSGANIMNGLNYGVETPSAYYGQLFQRALADAQKKSVAISNALGTSLSEPITITEGGYSSMPVYMNMNIAMEMAAGNAAQKQLSSTYTAPGDIDLSATVVVVYELK